MSLKDLGRLTLDHAIIGCDILGGSLRTETGNALLRYGLNIDPESFRPVALDYARNNEEADNFSAGEKAASLAGGLAGVIISVTTYGAVPAALLVYDIGRSAYLNRKDIQ